MSKKVQEDNPYRKYQKDQPMTEKRQSIIRIIVNKFSCMDDTAIVVSLLILCFTLVLLTWGAVPSIIKVLK